MSTDADWDDDWPDSSPWEGGHVHHVVVATTACDCTTEVLIDPATGTAGPCILHRCPKHAEEVAE